MRKFSFYFVFLLVVSSFVMVACETSDDIGPSKRRIKRNGAFNIKLVLPSDAEPALEMAAEDFVNGLAELSMALLPDTLYTKHSGTYDPSGAKESIVVLAGVLPSGKEAMVQESTDALQSQGYTIEEQEIASKIVIRVESPTHLGVAYGLYEILTRMGIQYYHPREIQVPNIYGAIFPRDFNEGFTKAPAYRLRGYHQHTEHPIVWSEYLLDPKEEYKPYVQEYLRYLLRNRQNQFQWHMLKTVDRDAWKPYAQWMVEEAEKYGVHLGLVFSFADQQQNCFRLIDDLGESLSSEERMVYQKPQIEENLEYLGDIGFANFTLQFGSNELTAQPDSETLFWFQTAVDWLEANAPETELYAWIHTPAHVMAEDGETPFYHLPLQADEAVGLMVHTTMFYDLEHPAPVYGNENFQHQQSCFTEGKGERAVAYFPESAWWLGFDNSLPLFLPITVYTRAYDAQTVIPPLMGDTPMDGHVTFSTGLEWNYWMYDHYVARLSWDTELTWEEYVDEISKIYSDNDKDLAASIAQVIKDTVERQKIDFIGDHPMMFYYLAGESEHDELGSVTGLAGRPTKLSYWKLYEYSDEDFEAWLLGDYARLEQMRAAYKEISDRLQEIELPDIQKDNEGLREKRHLELKTSSYLLYLRAEQAYLHYGAVRDARDGNEDDAYDKLEAAMQITSDVKQMVGEVEQDVYRYPLELVAEEKESLTAYPFGYLWETRTAYFWDRRDVQVKELLDVAFGKITEEFEIDTDGVLISDKEKTEILQPDSEAIRSIIKPYIPPVLLGYTTPSGGKADLVLATDANGNGAPDILSQAVMEDSDWGDEQVTGTFDSWTLTIRGDSGTKVGELIVREGTFTADLVDDLPKTATISGQGAFADVMEILISTGMFDEDTAWTTLAGYFGIDPDASPRPTTFAFEISTEFGPLE